MTAINVFRTKTQVHVITDGAMTSASGKMLSFGSKAHIYPHLQSVIAIRGSNQVALVLADTLSRNANDYDGLKVSALKVLSGELAGSFTKLFAKLVPSNMRELDVVIAGWSKKLNRSDSFLIATHSKHPGVPAMQIIDYGPYLIAPPLLEATSDLQSRIDQLRDGTPSHVISQLAADLVTKQCQAKNNVGGFCQLTTVTENLISSRIVARFSDKIGETRMPLAA